MKKVICLILSLILVLGMAVSAFAATSYDPTQNQPGNTFNPAPNNPKPGDASNSEPSFNPAPSNRHKDDDYVNPGVTDIVSEEENPNTGAPVFGMAAVVAAACVLFARKK